MNFLERIKVSSVAVARPFAPMENWFVNCELFCSSLTIFLQYLGLVPFGLACSFLSSLLRDARMHTSLAEAAVVVTVLQERCSYVLVRGAVRCLLGETESGCVHG